MRERRDKIVGRVDFDEPTSFHGLVDGDAVARTTLHMHGLITGNLTAQPGATIVIHGVINGTVLNNGRSVQVFGMVGGVAGSPPCEIMPGAKVG